MSNTSISSQPPSTRKGSLPQTQSSPAPSEKIESTSNNLPQPRRSPNLRTVSPPLSSIRLSRLIYILVGLTALLSAYYSYRVVQYKREVGGWWSLAMGKTLAQVNARAQGEYADSGSRKRKGRGEHEVEDRINALAQALGMPSNELASAIAGAVRSYVPPASLSSVAARETGEAVHILLSENQNEKGGASGKGASAAQATETASRGMMEGVVEGVGTFVGMDEP